MDWERISDEMESYTTQESKGITSSTNNANDITDKVNMLTTFRDSVQSQYQDVAKIVDYHINKYPGVLGTFGLAGGAAALLNKATTQTNNKTIAKSLSEIYRTKATNGSLSDIGPIPAIPSVDLDHPDNKPDFVFRNRTQFIRTRAQGEPPYAAGSVICYQGDLYVYVEGTPAASTAVLNNGWAKLSYVQITDPGGGGQ